MAYDKIYSRVNWENEPSVATPINETNLNNMDATIDELDDRVVELSRTTPCVQQVDELPEQGVIGVLYQLNTEYAQNFELDGLPDDLKTQANYNLYVSNGGKATMFHTTDTDNPFILLYDCYVSVYFTYKADGTTSDFYVRIMGTGLGTNPRLYTYNKTNKTWTYQAITSGAGDYILKVDGVFRQTVKQVEFPNITVSNSIGSVLPDCGLEWVSGDENNQQWFYYFYDETSDVPINDAKTYANNLWDIWSGYPYTIATTMYFWNGNGYSHLSNSSELAEYQRLLIQGDGINIDSNNVISTESPKQIFRDWTDNNDTTPYPYSVRYNTDADFKNAYGISTNDILNAVNSGKYYNLNLTILIDIGGIISYDEYSKCSVLYIDYSDMYEGGLSRNFDIFFMSDYHYTWWEDEGGIPIEHTKYYVMMPHVLSVFVQYTDTGAIRYIDAGMHRTYSISDINEGLGVSIDGGLISVKPKQNGGITVNADGVSVSESITNSIDNSTMIGTANGEIATIQDGGEDMSTKSCVVAIEPVQDLHGYDHPWSGGSGTNLIALTGTTSQTSGDVTFKGDGSKFKITGTSSSAYPQVYVYQANLKSGTYTISKTIIGTIPSNAYLYPVLRNADTQSQMVNLRGTNYGTFTIDSNTNIAILLVAEGNNITWNNQEIRIQIEKGSTATEWQPYENICPVIGWTECNLGISGNGTSKNLLPIPTNAYSLETQSGLTVEQKCGTFKITGTSTANTSFVFELEESVNLSPATNKIAFNNDKANSTVGVYFYRDTTLAHYWNMNSANRVAENWTDTGNENVNRILIQIPNNSTVDMVLKPILCSKNESDTSFVPYKGTANNIKFKDGTNPLIVHEGNVNFDTGELTIIRSYTDMSDLIWTYHSASGQYNDYFDAYLPNDSITGRSAYAENLTCERYKSIPSAQIAITGYDNGVMALANGTRRLIVCDQNYTDATAFTNMLSGKVLLYPLATPITYQLDPVTVKTLRGLNNFFADTGQILNLEYCRDATIVINNLLARIQELENA